uniref:Zinc-ribbon domain-containing protein n=1 Tax=mine drainage metagenome TaxID=410659 RepID=E6Q0Q9_9ZZZZ
MTCGNCGGPLDSGARFCKRCGTPVFEPSAPAVAKGRGPIIGVLVLAILAALGFAAYKAYPYFQKPVHVFGEWDGSFSAPGSPALQALAGPVHLALVQPNNGRTITGMITMSSLNVQALSGQVLGNDIEVSAPFVNGSAAARIVISGNVEGDGMRGTVSVRYPGGDSASESAPIALNRVAEPVPEPAVPLYSGAPPTNARGVTGGALHIQGGTGDFSFLSPVMKTLRVAPGATLTGTVTMNASNLGPGFAVAPMIDTPSWGDPSTSWQAVQGNVPPGQSQQTAQVSLRVPQQPGKYYLIFAFQWGLGGFRGGHVASATAWNLQRDVWRSGDDIASLPASKIHEAQVRGYTSMLWLGEIRQYVPLDAITLIVAGPTAKPTAAYELSLRSGAEHARPTHKPIGANSRVAERSRTRKSSRARKPAIVHARHVAASSVVHMPIPPRPLSAFMPVLRPDGSALTHGFSAAGNFVFTTGYIYLHAGATVSYRFIVPPGNELTIGYGLLAGHVVNNGPFTVSIDGTQVATVSRGSGGYGETVPTTEILWSKSFGPGRHMLTLTSLTHSVNVYGLWCDHPRCGR